MKRVRLRVVVAGLVAAAAFAVVLSLGGPRTAVPAAPPSPTEQVEYSGYYDNPADPEIARRLAAGEDPETIPGVVVMPPGGPAPLEPSAFSTKRGPGGQESDAGAPTPR